MPGNSTHPRNPISAIFQLVANFIVILDCSCTLLILLETYNFAGIKGSALDAAYSIGMGSTVIILIKKRRDRDMTIFFVGCNLVLVSLILLIIYF
jgi:hypothetical protein